MYHYLTTEVKVEDISYYIINQLKCSINMTKMILKLYHHP